MISPRFSTYRRRETFYTGIRALEPGEILEARLDGDRVSSKIQKYHQWVIAPILT